MKMVKEVCDFSEGETDNSEKTQKIIKRDFELYGFELAMTLVINYKDYISRRVI